MPNNIPEQIGTTLDTDEKILDEYKTSGKALKLRVILVGLIYGVLVLGFRSIIYSRVSVGRFTEIWDPFLTWIVLSVVSGVVFLIISLAILSMKVDVYVTDEQIITHSTYFFTKEITTSVAFSEITNIEKTQSRIDRITGTESVSIFTETDELTEEKQEIKEEIPEFAWSGELPHPTQQS